MNDNNRLEINVAKLQENVKTIRDDVAAIKESIREIRREFRAGYVSQKEFAPVKENYVSKEEFRFVKMLAYGLAGSIGAFVLTQILRNAFQVL